MRIGSLVVMLFFCSLSVMGEETSQAPRDLRDPFQKPKITEKYSEEPEAVKAPSQQAWIPQLKATLRSGRNSMANINGKIIKLGETINGYQLIEVGEKSALLVKNNQRLPLTIEYGSSK
jgi:hypothetical protein